MITVVSEGVFSYCGVKVKIDTDRYIGPEPAPIRVDGEQIGHVTTAEYGSQMLAIGGVRHLTGATKKETAASDDLTQLKGVGPAYAKKLNEAGITSFAQIAALTPEGVAELEEKLNASGRVERDGWIEQAKDLAK